MTNSATGSAVQDSDSSVELFSVSAGMSLRYSTRSHIRASSRVPVPVRIRIRAPRTGSAPSSSRIPRPKPGASASFFPRRSPFSRIPSLSHLPSPSSIPMTAPTPPSQPAQPASSSKRLQSPEDYAPLKRACSDWGQPSSAVARQCTPDLGSIPVPRPQGLIPPSDPLSRLSDTDAWEWPYGWKHFLGSPFVDWNGEGPIIPVTPIRSEEIDVNDGTRLVVQYTQSGEVFPFMSVFEYVCLFSDLLDARRFVLDMRICGVDFYVSDGHALRLTAAGGWASRWLHWGGRGAAWCRCRSDQTDTPFVRMKEEVDYEYRLSAMLGRFRRQFRSGDLLQGSMRPSIQLCCMDRPYYSLWCYRRRSFWKDALDFEHRARERTSSIRVFAGWHNVEVFAIRPQHRGSFFVSAGTPDWIFRLTKWLLLVLSPPLLRFTADSRLTKVTVIS